MIFPVLLAKFLSAGAVAQAATGATVAVVAFTGVGAAGALPGPVQDTFATVVATVTPLETPTSEETTEEVVAEETVAEEAETTDGATEVPEVTEVPEGGPVDAQAWIAKGPEGYDSFGAWVSESAHDPDLRAALRAEGMNFGSVISRWARDKGMGEDDLAAEGVDLGALSDEATTDAESTVDAEETVTGTTVETGAGTTAEDRGSRGNGKSKGKGKTTVESGSRGGSSNGGGSGRGNGRN